MLGHRHRESCADKRTCGPRFLIVWNFNLMTISVILPTYNRSGSLVAAINSVITQSHQDLELIVVDDASTEDIESVVRGFSDRRIRYVRRVRNGGAAAARNTGLCHAKGEYIAFQDSDDLWLPGKLQKQFALFSAIPGNVGAVIGAKIVYGRDNQRNYGSGRVAYDPPPEGRLSLDDDQLGRLLTRNRISLQNALFRKNCFPYAEWFDVCARANEDWDFAIRLAQHTSIYEDIEPVVLGFISPDSISINRRREIIGLLRILKKNRDVLCNRKEQKSLMLIDVARYFYTEGKRKSAMKFLSAAVKTYPRHLQLIGSIMVGKLFRRCPQRPAT